MVSDHPAVVLSLQSTNLVDPPTWVGLQNFRDVWNDPLFMTAVKNTAYFALLALLFGYPIPLMAAVLMSEARRFRGAYSALAYLPVVIPPVVGVMLWRYVFYEPSSVGLFNTVLGWFHLGPVRMAAVDGHGHARARRRVDMGQCRHHGDHLPRGTDVGRP